MVLLHVNMQHIFAQEKNMDFHLYKPQIDIVWFWNLFIDMAKLNELETVAFWRISSILTVLVEYVAFNFPVKMVASTAFPNAYRCIIKVDSNYTEE